MNRDELLEVGARAWHADSWKVDGDSVSAIIDAVEPLIRADERDRGLATVYGYELGASDTRADLRAKVEALSGSPNSALDWVLRVDVLSLLDEEHR